MSQACHITNTFPLSHWTPQFSGNHVQWPVGISIHAILYPGDCCEMPGSNNIHILQPTTCPWRGSGCPCVPKRRIEKLSLRMVPLQPTLPLFCMKFLGFVVFFFYVSRFILRPNRAYKSTFKAVCSSLISLNFSSNTATSSSIREDEVESISWTSSRGRWTKPSPIL